METAQELKHWGVKGQKWGIRRYQNPDGTLTEAGKKHYYYQNPDGSLTEEGKKNYMKAFRKGKIDPKKLSDNDLNMINSRFARERQYKQNYSEYEKSKLSYKLKEAAISKIKGKGGGGGSKSGGSSISKFLAMPIKKAFEDAMKFDADKGGWDKEEKQDTQEAEFYRRNKKGRHFFDNGYHEDKSQRAAREANGRRFMESNGRDNPMNSRSSRSSEDILRNRRKGNSVKPSNGSRNILGLPSGGIRMDPSEYSIHSDTAKYIITRDDSANI